MQHDKDRKKISIGEAIKIRNRQQNKPSDIKQAWQDEVPLGDDKELLSERFLDDFIDKLAAIKNRIIFIFDNVVKQKKLPRISTSKRLTVSKRTKVFLTVGILFVAFMTTLDTKTPEKKEFITDQLGASTAAPAKQLPVVESTPGASLLFSGSKSQGDFEIVKVSPDGSDNVYAYIDTIGGTDVKVSQQALPVTLEDEADSGLRQLAAGFQATDVIKVDSIVIYHGFTEKNGGVQSIIFTKNDILVFISSPEKLSDTLLAAYVASLK